MTGLDKIFKFIYSSQCYGLIVVSVSSLITVLYSKIFFGRILYYGVPDERNIGHQSFFDILSILYNFSLLLVILWPFFAVISIATEKYRNSSKLISKIGVAGFIATLHFLIADPFGIWEYFID